MSIAADVLNELNADQAQPLCRPAIACFCAPARSLSRPASVPGAFGNRSRSFWRCFTGGCRSDAPALRALLRAPQASLILSSRALPDEAACKSCRTTARFCISVAGVAASQRSAMEFHLRAGAARSLVLRRAQEYSSQEKASGGEGGIPWACAERRRVAIHHRR